MLRNEIIRKSIAKLSGNGRIEYAASVDKNGFLYVQIINNDASGTHAENIFFSVEVLVALKSGTTSQPLFGLNQEGNSITVMDNNIPGFLKAIAYDLLP